MDDLIWLLTKGAKLVEGLCVSNRILCVSRCLTWFVIECVCVCVCVCVCQAEGKRVVPAAQPSSAHSELSHTPGQ